MTKRIRYYEREPNIWVSVRTIQTNHGAVTVQYNLDSMVTTILSAEGDKVLDTFTSPNHFVMKKAIKEKLISMGAEFAPEKRVRGANAK